jgi:aminoglycoside 2'-N-acetyltransferase I
MQVRVRQRGDFTPRELGDLLHWLEDAYDDGPWREQHWDEIGPGPHIVAEGTAGELLAHACIAWVPIRIGETTLDTGYLEDVATRPDLRGRGLGSAVVEAAHPLIEANAEIGFLATGSPRFYERLGWVTWLGASSVTELDGSVTSTPEEDGNIMALFVPATPRGISPELPICRPRRDDDEAW